MAANRSRPPGTVLVTLIYDDVPKAIEWLCDVFCFTERLRAGNSHAQLTFGEGGIMLGQSRTGQGFAAPDSAELRQPRPNEVTHVISVHVPDVDRHYEHALSHGARILQSPVTHLYGERQYSAVSASLSSFRETQERACNLSVRLGEQCRAISDAFGKLIVSIQFHDITRQQIEHVTAALQRLCSESPEGIGRDPDAVEGNAALRGTAVLVLQCSQLAHAAGQFSASVTSLADNLDEIAGRVMEMTEESQQLFRHSPNEKDSLFLEMERCYGAILARLTNCTRVEIASRETSDTMADTLLRMRGSIQQVQAIGMKMFYAAINARIRAAHLGEKGNSLDVLANSMRQGALDSIQRSESLIALLDSMGMAVFDFSGQDVGAPEGEDACLAEMRVAVAELHSSGESSLAQIAEILTAGTKLREELSATRESFTVGGLVEESVSRARGSLQQLADNDRAGLSISDGEELQRQLADFEKHYTMQSERDVHASAIGAKPPTEPLEDLNDNVEFF